MIEDMRAWGRRTTRVGLAGRRRAQSLTATGGAVGGAELARGADRAPPLARVRVVPRNGDGGW